jgi:hypothetical protein
MNTRNSNSIIHKIKEYLPNEKLQFKRNEYTNNIEVFIIDKRATITVLEENTWDEIKRHIDVKISNEKPIECSICLSKDIIIRRATCTKCARDWCIDCYINIFRTNNGIIKCPFCRFTYGNIFPDNMIEIGVQQILNSL